MRSTPATVMAYGSPQNTPVWFDYVDGKVRMNSAVGRVKVRNMQLGGQGGVVDHGSGQP